MKGKSLFTKQEAQLIEASIVQKLKENDEQQKGTRARIRKLGFYSSDFGVGNGYTVADFRRVVTIDGKTQIALVAKQPIVLLKAKKGEIKRNKITK